MNMYQGVKGNAVQAVAQVCADSCQKLTAQIERTKTNLLNEWRKTLEVPERLFQLVLGEAEALAWQTDYPHLLFPVLAMEKVEAAAEWNTRQKFIRQKNSGHSLSI